MSKYSQVKVFNSRAVRDRSFPHTVGWHSSASRCSWVYWWQTGALWSQSGCFQLGCPQDPWKETPISMEYFFSVWSVAPAVVI